MTAHPNKQLSRPAALLAACAIALAIAGCGGGGVESPAEPRDGKTIFTEYCGACHTLSAAGSGGGSGPNLDQLESTAAAIAAQVENGGGGMPAFGDRLSPEEIEVVSKYIADNTAP